MKRVRVLEVIASSRGGGASHVYDLATHLDATRFEVEVAMPEDGGNVMAADFEQHGLLFHPLEIASGFSRAALGDLRRMLAEVDLLHLHGARAALFGRLAAATLAPTTLRGKRPRIVYTIHGFAAPHYTAPRRQVLLGIERSLAPLVDHFVAVSQDEKRALVAAKVARPEQVSVVWNGIDVARFQSGPVDIGATRRALGIPLDATLVTTVCRLFKPRDFATLLAAMRIVVDCAAAQAEMPPQLMPHLMIVGDGPLRAEIVAQVTALDLAPHVTLAGWQRDMPAIYAATDLFVLTTWGWEGLPLTVLEAMAAGKAVVASRAGGIPEEVAEGETGLLVEQRNVQALAAALTKLVMSPTLRQRFGEAGAARVAKEFALPVMVQKSAAVYAQVMRTGVS